MVQLGVLDKTSLVSHADQICKKQRITRVADSKDKDLSYALKQFKDVYDSIFKLGLPNVRGNKGILITQDKLKQMIMDIKADTRGGILDSDKDIRGKEIIKMM